MKHIRKLLVDSGVISTLADETTTGSKFKKEQNFYRRETELGIWHVTQDIMSELDRMCVRKGKIRLYEQCLDLLEKRNAIQLPYMDLPHIAHREDVKAALKDHYKNKSDERDRRNIYRAIYEKLVFICHDNTLYQRVKNLSDLDIVSLYGQARKGSKTVRRGRGGNRLD